MSEWSFLATRRWLGYFALLLVFSVVSASLGLWQFDRRAQAQAEIARIDANYGAKPVALSELVDETGEFVEERDKWRPVVVQGEYVATPLYVRNRPRAAQVGFEQLALLKQQDGSVFVVNRGWIPAGEDPSKPAQRLPLPAGPVVVEARLKAGEPAIAGRLTTGDVLATIDLAEVSRLSESDVLEGAYGLLISETPAAEHGELASPPERDEGPHLSYALQWFVFILVALAGTIYGVRAERRALRRQSDGVKRAQPRRRKAPNDAELEDAWLDQHGH